MFIIIDLSTVEKLLHAAALVTHLAGDLRDSPLACPPAARNAAAPDDRRAYDTSAMFVVSAGGAP